MKHYENMYLGNIFNFNTTTILHTYIVLSYIYTEILKIARLNNYELASLVNMTKYLVNLDGYCLLVLVLRVEPKS